MLGQLPQQQYYEHMAALQYRRCEQLLRQLRLIRDLSDPHPPQLADLPADLVKRFVGRGDQLLMRVYPRSNSWEMPTLQAFVTDVRRVDSRVTGHPLRACETALETKHAHQQAVLYALVVVIGVVAFRFGTAKQTLLALAPPALGTLAMLGFLGWLHLPWNATNTFAVLLMQGIGASYGVLMADGLRDHGGLRSASGTTVVMAAAAMLISSGSLMTANHQGLESLGRALTLGVTCSLLASLVTLPALRIWLTREQADEEPETEEDFGVSDDPATPTPDQSRSAPALESPPPAGRR